jgi:hypothetical protein
MMIGAIVEKLEKISDIIFREFLEAQIWKK